MEPSKISEILDDLKNRFASRFIFSYTIAWLLFNWKITIALLWYDKTQIEAEGCKSIFEFISDQLEITSNGWEVLCAALIYTFVLPISKSIINVWDEIILVLRNWIKTKVDVNQDAKTIKSLQSKLSMINNYHYLDGYWHLRYITTEVVGNTSTGYENKIDVIISNTEYYIIENDSRKKKYDIKDFTFNPLNNKMMFKLQFSGIKNDDKNNFFDSDVFCTLTMDENKISLEGKHNNNEVFYNKI